MAKNGKSEEEKKVEEALKSLKGKDLSREDEELADKAKDDNK